MGCFLTCLTLCLGLLLSPAAAVDGRAQPASAESPSPLTETVRTDEWLQGKPAPGSLVTRGDVLLLLWQSAGAVPYDVTAHPFSDLEGRDDLRQAAGWAYGLGLVKGVGDGLFAPDRTMTREEFATLLRRSDAFWGRDVWLPDGAALCNDYADISPWADDSLYWACIMGRMDWRDCRLAPLDGVTRAEAEAVFPPCSEPGPGEAQADHTVGFSSCSQVLPSSSIPPQVSNLRSIIAQVTYQYT